MPHLPKKQPRRAYTVRKRSKDEYGNEAYNWYNSTRWRNLSKRQRDTARRLVIHWHDGTEIETDKPACEVCNEREARVTDHVIPIQVDGRGFPTSKGGAATDEYNLMVMCHQCHNRKRGKERHGFVVDSVRTENGLIPKDRQDIINILRGQR